MPLKTLEAKKGFSLDMRAPNSDSIAYRFACKWFGPGNVNRITKQKHRAVVSHDAIKMDIMDYDRTYSPRVEDPVYLAVLQSVRRDFIPEEKIIPWTLGHVIQDGVPKTKSPGLPWKERGFKSKREVLENEEARKEIYTEWYKIGKGYKQDLPDTMVYFRSQICDRDTNKIRSTWGYPTSCVLEEGRFVYPYLAWIRHTDRDVPVAYGVEMANGGMGYIDEMYQLAPTGSKAIMMDWKKFDKTIPPWLIRDAFQIMAECFDMSKVLSSDGRVWPVDPQQTQRRWSKMIRYFINTPFILPTGERFQKDGGVPSGSGFTNIIDTIVNAIVSRYCVYHCTGSLPSGDIFMGDDSVLIVNGIVNLDDIAKLAEDRFGMTVNVAKSFVTRRRENLFFLGYYNNFGFPFRDQDFLIASFIFPERFHQTTDPKFTAVRALGQLWSTMNGVAANMWLEIVEDIVKEYSLPHDWFDEIMTEYPNMLKFLRLHGIDDRKIVVPRRSGWILSQVHPPEKPSRRRPLVRKYDIEQLYEDYTLTSMTEEEYFATFSDERLTNNQPDDDYNPASSG